MPTHHRPDRHIRAACGLLLAAIVLASSVAGAATFTVNSVGDATDPRPGDGVCATSSGECTLRAAIQETNARSGADTINLLPVAYTLLLNAGGEDLGATGDLDIRDDLTIIGGVSILNPKAVASISPARKPWNDRIIHVHSGVTVVLSRVLISGGNTTVIGGPGGAIRVDPGATLTLANCQVTGSKAGSRGGGISNAGTLTLTSSTVRGNTAVDGGGIHNEAIGNLTVTGSTITGNMASVGAGGIESIGGLTLTDSTISANTGSAGGGISTSGSGSITRCSISGNRAVFGGGGISTCDNVLTLADSTVSGNDAAGENGGGVRNCGALTITNCTLSGNTALGSGGGIRNFFGGTVDVNNATITSNASDLDGSGDGNGGGISTEGTTGGPIVVPAARVSNTIIAGNGSNNPGARFPDCAGALNTQGPNLIQTITGCATGSGFPVVVGRDPLLGPLQANGGRTATHALLAGSPAIDAGNAGGILGVACAAADQRGVARPQDGNADGIARCDLGAFEVAPVGTFVLTPHDAVTRVGDHLTWVLTYTVTDGRSWRDLATLDFRVHDGDETPIWVRFTEAAGDASTLALVDPRSGETGPAFVPGRPNVLQTAFGTLHLEGSSIDASGPESSTVVVTLEVSLKPQAAGRTYDVEVVATDDLGNIQAESAGTLEVDR